PPRLRPAGQRSAAVPRRPGKRHRDARPGAPRPRLGEPDRGAAGPRPRRPDHPVRYIAVGRVRPASTELSGTGTGEADGPKRTRKARKEAEQPGIKHRHTNRSCCPSSRPSRTSPLFIRTSTTTPGTTMTDTTHALLALDDIAKVFYTDEVETHALS